MSLKVDKFEIQAMELKQKVGQATVTSDKKQKELEEVMVVTKGFLKEIDATFDPIIKAAHETHKEAVAQKKRIAAPYNGILQAIKQGISKWLDKKEAEERKRQAEALAKLREAEKAKAPEAVIEKVEDKVLASIDRQATREGSSYKRYSAEVVDTMALIKAVAAGKVPIEAVTPNMPFLNQMVIKSDDKENWRIPGVRSVSKRVM